jgi:hypothetical protein
MAPEIHDLQMKAHEAEMKADEDLEDAITVEMMCRDTRDMGSMKVELLKEETILAQPEYKDVSAASGRLSQADATPTLVTDQARVKVEVWISDRTSSTGSMDVRCIADRVQKELLQGFYMSLSQVSDPIDTVQMKRWKDFLERGDPLGKYRFDDN